MLNVVVDRVLYEQGIHKDMALRRAKAIMTIGGIFKAVEADESDDERRELERYVHRNLLKNRSILMSSQACYERR